MKYIIQNRCQPTEADNLIFNEACVFAARVIHDMGRAFTEKSPLWADWLGERFGGIVWEDLEPSGAYGQYFPYNDTIKIDWRCHGNRKRCRVIRHEIAHKLCFSGRYDDLEGPHLADFDRRVFAELIAELVEMAFILPGLHLTIGKYLS